MYKISYFYSATDVKSILNERYFIKLSFQGTGYHGWQVQPDAPTVQDVLQKDLGLLLDERIRVTGCGRTDTGVHANIFFAHFDTAHKDLDRDSGFLFKVNSKLPGDIVIHEFIAVRPEAHARFSALSRTYEYHIHRKKHAFHRDMAHYIYGDLDIEGMQEASEILKEYTDFTSFSKVDTESRTKYCRIQLAQWEQVDSHLIFTIKADRFLRNMVRAIVGTMLDIGSGKLDLAGFRNIIERKNRSAAGASVPARGLILTDVEYPPEIFIL